LLRENIGVESHIKKNKNKKRSRQKVLIDVADWRAEPNGLTTRKAGEQYKIPFNDKYVDYAVVPSARSSFSCEKPIAHRFAINHTQSAKKTPAWESTTGPFVPWRFQ
jgi:hypothetical protein